MGGSMTGQEARGLELLAVSEAAKLLHVHCNTLRKWANTGMIRTYRLGSRRDRRFSLVDVVEFLNRHLQFDDEPSYAAK